jgi:hypothetical protein
MALPPSRVSGSSWPEPVDFVFRKKRKKGRRGRRGSAVAAKENAKLKRHAREIIAAPFLRSPSPQATDTKSPMWRMKGAAVAPTPMLRRTYRGVVVASDPFKGETCPGCAATFAPDYPAIEFPKGHPLRELSGYCIRCVQRPESIKLKRKRWDAAIPIADPAFARYVSKLRRARQK